LRRAAHTLKGSVHLFASDAAVEAAGRLEEIGSAEEFAKAADALAALEVAVGQLVPALRARVVGA